MLTSRQESIVNQLTKAIRLRGCAAASFVAAAVLVVGCGGPEGAGTVNMSAAKEAAARRGLPDGSKRTPVTARPARSCAGQHAGGDSQTPTPGALMTVSTEGNRRGRI